MGSHTGHCWVQKSPAHFLQVGIHPKCIYLRAHSPPTPTPITEISTFSSTVYNSIQSLQLGIRCFWEQNLSSPARFIWPTPPGSQHLPPCSPHTHVCAFAHVDFFMETWSGLPSPACLPLETPGTELAPRPCVVLLAFIAHGAQGHRSPAPSPCTLTKALSLTPLGSPPAPRQGPSPASAHLKRAGEARVMALTLWAPHPSWEYSSLYLG